MHFVISYLQAVSTMIVIKCVGIAQKKRVYPSTFPVLSQTYRISNVKIHADKYTSLQHSHYTAFNKIY